MLRFDFGGGGVAAPGFTRVTPETTYSKERGYGFEPGSTVVAVERGGDDPVRRNFCTSERPFYFSVALPEGNYRVTVTLGDRAGESATTVKAELRRLVQERVRTATGKFETRAFVVNVRTPRFPGGEVRLKDRERVNEAWNWDEKLTLEFNDTRPCVCAVEITPVNDVPTLFLLGDSTVTDQPNEPWNSWGQMLPRFFKPEIAVANHAQSGESLRSSLSARRLDKVVSAMKGGDYLFIQYGHNDMKEKGEGVSAFTTYAADLKRFVAATRSRGGNPVLITSMHRKRLDDRGKIQDTFGDYPEAVRRVAREENVPLIDLHALSATLYEALGPKKIDRAFQDGTHHNSYGSYLLAKCVVTRIRQAKLPLTRLLADDVPPFDPARPDPFETFQVPPSAGNSATTPLGS